MAILGYDFNFYYLLYSVIHNLHSGYGNNEVISIKIRVGLLFFFRFVYTENNCTTLERLDNFQSKHLNL